MVHVEDDGDFAFILGVWLKRAGFKQPIVHCRDGALALHYFSMIEPADVPDIIVLDLHMPKMNGLEVLHWLRHSYRDPDIAVYLLTSSDEPADKRQAAADNVTEYLLKSPLFHELICHLDKFIATTNGHRMEEARKMGDIMAELALMGKFAAEMVALTDVQGQIVWANQNFVQNCGFTAEEMLGQQPGSILQVAKPDLPKVEKLHDAVRSVRAYNCQILHHKRNGVPRPLEISLGPIFQNNKLEGFLAVGLELGEEETRDDYKDYIET